MAEQRTLVWTLGLGLGILAYSPACGKDDNGGFAGEIEFEGQQPFLPGFEYDTGFLPADSPAAIRIVARAEGGVVAKARATTDGTSLSPVAGSGELSSSGEFLLEVSARIDAVGVDYEGVVDSFGYAIDPVTTTFDPFLLDGMATVEAALPASELARVPIPSVPGTTLIIDVTGGTITTAFSGACAEANADTGQYVGRTTTTGVIELDGTIEIEIPIVGTETFGPFPFSVPIPELTNALDLGVRSLQTAEAIDGPGPCDDGVAATGGGADDDTPDPDSMDDGSTPATDAADDTGTTDEGATDADPSTDDDAADSTDDDSSDGTDTGPICLDDGLEPNDSPGTAELQDRDAPYECDGYSLLVAGTLDGPDDVDWFSIPSSDTDADGCDHYANIDIADARVCIFAECAVVGELTATCIEGTPTMSPTGAPGCCSTVGAGSLRFECDADSSTLIDAQVRVDQGTVCEEYSAVYEHNPS